MRREQDVMSVSEVREQIDRLDGMSVQVRGLLVVLAEGAYLVQLGDRPPEPTETVSVSADRLFVDAPDLVDRLFAAVPVYVGGPFSYRDEAILAGRVVRRSDGAPTLTEIGDVTVVRLGNRYEVSLDRQEP
ncbi:hypothetical protein [Streptomyces afghaniensis 772] [Streptomyces afghaniensis]|uniref:hypothetical protein n=1 Tax=Streptomyces afghaniensis TaxID=66865 RepID=UPI00055C746C|nr:hypothetical protein [Streptomyces afghaniensis]